MKLAAILIAVALALSISFASLPSLPGVPLPDVSLPAPKIVVPLSQLRDIAIFAVLLCYIFAAGKIADFLQSSGRKISKREALLAPFAYMFLSCLGLLAYVSSGLWVPPQNTLITTAVYLLGIPLGIVIGLGAIVLYGFFRDRLNPVQSLDLSMRIILAPIFDGLRGYWTALGAAAILGGISGFTYWSSGGNFSLVTLDFLLLSSVVALYFLYRALTSHTNEGKASNVVTMLTIIAPSVLRLFFKDLVCAGLSLIPLDFFRSCPLQQVGNEVTLALSVAATLILLVPIIPVIYAMVVNLLRVATVVELLMRREQPHAHKAESEGEGKGESGWIGKKQ